MGDVTGNWTPAQSLGSLESLGSLGSGKSSFVGRKDESSLKGHELAKAIGFQLPLTELQIPGIRSSWTDSFRDKSCIESRGELSIAAGSNVARANFAPVNVARANIDKVHTLSTDNCLLSTDLIEIPISISEAISILAYDAVISYDSDVLEPVFERPVSAIGTLSTNFNVVVNRGELGKLKLVAYGIAPVNGDGDLIVLRFRVKNPNARISDAKLVFESLVINEKSVISNQ